MKLSSPQETNPFASPQSAADVSKAGQLDTDARRPSSPMVYGVIGIVVGGFGIVGGVIGLVSTAVMLSDSTPQPGMPTSAIGVAYVVIAGIVGLVASGFLLAAAIALVRYQKSGPGWFNIYAYMSIFLLIAGTIYSWMMMSTIMEQIAQDPQMAQTPGMEPIMKASLAVGMVTSLLWLVYPVSGLILLNKDRVKDSLT